jgi:hypothetical protein
MRPPPLSIAATRAGRNVAVERGDDGAPRGANAAAHRRRLPRRDGVPELPEMTVPLHQRVQPLGGGIGRAIIDIDDFVRPPAVERACDFRDQRRDVFRFVAHGHNNGNGHRSLVGRRQFGTHRLNGLGLA